MSHTSRLIAVISIGMALVGCGSSPPVRYYGLDPIDTTYNRDEAGSPILGLGPLRIPEYLSRSQIVMRDGTAEIIVDDYHRWAEPIEQSFHRIVASNVDALVNGMAVIAFPYNASLELDYQVLGRIEQFDADSESLAVLRVQWSVINATNELVVAPRRSRYESRGATPNDPGAVATAMNDCMAQFSRDIAQEMSRIMHSEISSAP